jgi:MscS family membrane protein
MLKDIFEKGGDEMISVMRPSHAIVGIVRYCLFFIFAGMVFFMGIPEGLSAPPKAPTVKDLIEDEPEKKAPSPAPAVESTSQAVTKGVLKGEVKPEVVPEAPAPPVDEYDPEIPRNAVKGFFWACGERDFEHAAKYLDLRYLPHGLDSTNGPELARKLYIILTRSIWIDITHLSDRPEGHQDDGLPPYRDRLGGIETDEKKYDLYLQQVPDDKGKTVWKISNRTVGQIPELYARFGHGILEDKLPLWVFDFQIWGIYVWEWVALVIGAAGSMVLVLALTGPIFFLLRRWDTALSRQLLRVFTSPLRLLLFSLFFSYWLVLINPSFTVQALAHAGTLRLIALSWFLMRVSDFSLDLFVRQLQRKGQAPSPVLIPVFGNAIKIVIVITAVMFWLDNLGFQVTAILAGLGISGLGRAKELGKLFWRHYAVFVKAGSDW